MVANIESMFSGTKQIVYEKVLCLGRRVGVGLGCVKGTVLCLGRVGVVLGWSGYSGKLGWVGFGFWLGWFVLCRYGLGVWLGLGGVVVCVVVLCCVGRCHAVLLDVLRT